MLNRRVRPQPGDLYSPIGQTARMPTRRVHLIGPVPIPIGHRVEITWYQEEETTTGLLGGDKKKVTPIETPVVVDAETGIRYGLLAHFDEDSAYRGGQINLQEHRLRDSLVSTDRLTGTVIACSSRRRSDSKGEAMNNPKQS